ncbi:MAG TPA: hypothetical protein VF018_04415 [Acidobacteriaceae bacterium]
MDRFTYNKGTTMRNSFVVLLAITVMALAVVIHSQSAKIAALQSRTADIKTAPQAANMELQSQCAKQAAIAFKQSGWSTEKLADSINHYNTVIGKCFVEITNTTIENGHPGHSAIVSDAFEGKVYGSYQWINVTNKQFWEVPPTECEVTMPTGETKYCKSSEEFEDLTKIYMQ